MSSTRVLLAAVAAGVLTLGASVVAVAAPTTAPTPAPVPGPKQPIEHLGLSGGLFQVTSGTGNVGCYGSGGTEAASYPVPRGALVTGVTAYVTDSSTDTGVGVDLNRHSLVSGGTYRLGTASTTGTPGATTITVDVSPGVLLDEASSVNVDVRIGKSVCFKGAEVHFIRNGAAAAPSTGQGRAPEPTATAAAPDGAVR